VSATVTLQRGSVAPSGAATIAVHRITSAWSESAVTWQSFGGAFDSTSEISFSNTSSTMIFDASTLVSAWVHGTATNNGLLLVDPALTYSTQYRSSEDATGSFRPKLDICYTVTCATGFADCDSDAANGCETAGACTSCTDGIQNGSETDIDCGGTCGQCLNGKACSTNGDCRDGTCQTGVCTGDGEWIWIDVPGSLCGNNTETGILYNPAPNGSQELVIVFDGGALCNVAGGNTANCIPVALPNNPSCTTAANCSVSHYCYNGTCAWPTAAAYLSYGASELANDPFRYVGIFDRGDTTNPYRNFNIIRLPNCTGDFHVGQKNTTYTNSLATATIYHRGWESAQTRLDFISDNLFPLGDAVSRIHAIGISAGAFGLPYHYQKILSLWSGLPVLMVLDSGQWLDTGTSSTPGYHPESTLLTRMDSAWGVYGTWSSVCSDCAPNGNGYGPAHIYAHLQTAGIPVMHTSMQRDSVISIYLGAPNGGDSGLMCSNGGNPPPACHFGLTSISGYTQPGIYDFVTRYVDPNADARIFLAALPNPYRHAILTRALNESYGTVPSTTYLSDALAAFIAGTGGSVLP